MIEPEHARLSIVRQCELVGISRSSWYYRPCGESDLNLRLMREIDEQYLITPWYGSRCSGQVIPDTPLGGFA